MMMILVIFFSVSLEEELTECAVVEQVVGYVCIYLGSMGYWCELVSHV